MAYVPDSDDSGAPLDTEYASTAAAEFRALKAKVNNFFLNSNYNADQNANHTDRGLAIFNIGGTGDLLYSVLGIASRTAGDGSTFGSYVSAELGNSITGAVASQVTGFLAQASTGTTDSVTPELNGGHLLIVQRNNSGQAAVNGLKVEFFDRTAGLAAVPGGIGDDKYNLNATAIRIQSQRRGSDSEKCGWPRGIRFDDYSLDEEDGLLTPAAIDFTGISQTDAAGGSVAFHFNSASLVTTAFTNAGAVVMPTVVAKILPVMVDGIVSYGIPLCTII